MTTNDAQILLVDDHPLMGVALRQMLEMEEGFSVVAQAHTGDEALRLLDKHRPDALILDMVLPGASPEEILAHIQAAGHPTKVLILSAYSESIHVQKILAAGASGYVLKNESPEAILDALSTVLQGGIWLSPSLARQMAGGSSAQPSPLEAAGLTVREREVLWYMSRGYSNGDMAETLCISERTVKYHIQNIYAKLGTHSRSKVIVWAWQSGLVKPDADA